MDKRIYKVGFVGCGNMGGVLLRRVIENIGAEHTAICEPMPEKAQAFVDMGADALSLTELASHSEIIFLAVKPQVLPAVLTDMKDALAQNPTALLVTMAAGVDIAKVASLVKSEHSIIRIMPNLPASVGKGVILYCTNEKTTQAEKALFLSLLQGAGLLDAISEEDIDAASVVSGCGPAFVYRFAEAFVKAAVACGVEEEKALLYVKHTLLGAASVMCQTQTPLSSLVDAVCSPKGTTIEGIDKLNALDVDALLKETLQASYARTLELKKG
ncbi:MAG: pyrroline-5-carboxylate reductase [Clostridia bacterium]|nr:pyrroline-5-carboxylate reductase [Clostridia bacterium]